MDNDPSSSNAAASNPTAGETSSGSGGAVGSGGAAGGAAPRDAPRAIIKNVDMSEEMQQEAVDVATQALEKFNIEKDIAQHIKREFDRRYGSTWHCVVGKNYGSFVTHETKHFVYFYISTIAILLWKSS